MVLVSSWSSCVPQAVAVGSFLVLRNELVSLISACSTALESPRYQPRFGDIKLSKVEGRIRMNAACPTRRP